MMKMNFCRSNNNPSVVIDMWLYQIDMGIVRCS